MYGIGVTITHAGQSGKAEVDQTARFTGWTSSNRGLEMDCIGTLLHEQLVSERPGQPDEQVGRDSPQHSVYATPPRTKCVAQRHNYLDGEPGYFQRGIPAQAAKPRLEFDDQVRRELEHSHRDD